MIQRYIKNWVSDVLWFKSKMVSVSSKGTVVDRWSGRSMIAGQGKVVNIAMSEYTHPIGFNCVTLYANYGVFYIVFMFSFSFYCIFHLIFDL